ncbi:MAG: RidA family protein [Ilumatobacteraceae bacterium]
MAKHIIATDHAPSSPLYSQGVRVGTTIYVAGMAGVDPVTKEMAGPSIQAQTHQSISNCQAVLEAGGASLADVVSVTVLLADPADWGGLNEAYAIAFPTAPPTRMVCRLGPDLPGVLVSIAMIAEIDH